MVSRYIEHLAAIRLFSSCSTRDLQKIARASDEIEVEAGRELTVEGQPGHEAFVIVEGSASVVIGDRHVAELGAGRHFGELALLDGGPRTATVVALTPMTLLVINQRAFLSLLDDVPGLARKVMATLAAQVRELDQAADSTRA